MILGVSRVLRDHGANKGTGGSLSADDEPARARRTSAERHHVGKHRGKTRGV